MNPSPLPILPVVGSVNSAVVLPVPGVIGLTGSLLLESPELPPELPLSEEPPLLEEPPDDELLPLELEPPLLALDLLFEVELDDLLAYALASASACSLASCSAFAWASAWAWLIAFILF